MKQVNRDRLRQAIEDIQKSITRLQQLGKVSLDEFLLNEDYQDIARSRLLTAIEASIKRSPVNPDCHIKTRRVFKNHKIS